MRLRHSLPCHSLTISYYHSPSLTHHHSLLFQTAAAWAALNQVRLRHDVPFGPEEADPRAGIIDPLYALHRQEGVARQALVRDEGGE